MATAIKIAVTDAIKLLQNRLAEAEKWKAENDKIDAEFEVADKKYEAECLALAAKLSKDGKWELSNHRYYSKKEIQFEVTYDRTKFPKPPSRAENPYRQLHLWEVQEIEGVIRLLEVSQEPVVSAGTLNKITKFI